MSNGFRNGRLGVLVGLLGLLPAGCNSDARDEPNGPFAIAVETMRVQSRAFSERLEIVGQLAAAESVVIRPEISGVVASVEFQEGQRVAAGDVLFILEAREQRALLRQSEANRVLAADVFDRTEKLSKVKVSAVSEVTRAKAGVDAAEAEVDLARVNVDRTQIRAPFDGAVGARHVSPGDWVDSDVELVQIDAVDRLQLQFSLAEQQIALAKLGLKVTAQVAAYPDQDFAGEVYFVSPSLDPLSRRLALKAWVANEDGRLRPGMFAHVELEVDRTQNAIVVPESSIAYDANGPFIWRVTSENLAERIGVELGPRQTGEVVISDGIAVGDTIVTTGTHKVYAGAGIEMSTPDVAAELR